jgi:hypothetical protein
MKTWAEFKKGKLKAHIKSGKKATEAMKLVGKEWREYKKKMGIKSKPIKKKSTNKKK